MQYRAALAAALLPLASAFQVTITSNCNFDVYGWNVVNDYGTGAPTFTLSQGSTTSWTSPFQQKIGGGGPSIKLQKNPSLFVNAEQTQVEYDMAGGTMFYDMSDVNGHPFQGCDMSMQTSNPSCPSVSCSASEAVCSQFYQHPDDIRTLACDGGADLQVVLCGGSSGSSAPSTSSASPPPVAAPVQQPTTLATSAAPTTTAPATTQQAENQQGNGFLEESPQGDIEVVVATTVIAVTSTVHKPGPSGDPASKREAEAHLHAHLHRGHSRVMGRHSH